MNICWKSVDASADRCAGTPIDHYYRNRHVNSKATRIPLVRPVHRWTTWIISAVSFDLTEFLTFLEERGRLITKIASSTDSGSFFNKKAVDILPSERRRFPWEGGHLATMRWFLRLTARVSFASHPGRSRSPRRRPGADSVGLAQIPAGERRDGSTSVGLGRRCRPGSSLDVSASIGLGRRSRPGSGLDGSASIGLGRRCRPGSGLDGSASVGLGRRCQAGERLDCSTSVGLGRRCRPGSGLDSSASVGLGRRCRPGNGLDGSASVGLGRKYRPKYGDWIAGQSQ